jgi:acyl carrier protein
MKDINLQLVDIFKRVLKNDKLRLNENTGSKDVEGWDSLAQVELISEIESHFEIEFALKDLSRMNTFGNICLLIQEKLSL